MATIKLDLDSSSLTVNSNNELDIIISPDSGNTLYIHSGGLYSAAPKGENGSTGSGYTGQYATDCGTNVGCASPYGVNGGATNHSIQCKFVVHRTWETSNTLNSDGTSTPNLTDFRNKIDYVLPGDILYDGTNYFVVTTVTSNDLDAYGNMLPGNTISSYAKM